MADNTRTITGKPLTSGLDQWGQGFLNNVVGGAQVVGGWMNNNPINSKTQSFNQSYMPAPVQANAVGNIVGVGQSMVPQVKSAIQTNPNPPTPVDTSTGNIQENIAAMKAFDAGGTPTSTTPAGQTAPASQSPVNADGTPNAFYNFNTSGTGANTPFTLSGNGATSDALSSGVTGNDVLQRRQQMENALIESLHNQASAQTNLQTQQAQDLGNVQNALYSGNTTDFGQGAAGLARNAANIAETLAQTKLQGAQLQTSNTAKVLDFMNQDIQNQLATVPNLQNVQQSADGSIIGFIRDPMTGQVTSQNFGNPAMGTFSSKGQSGANIGGGSVTSNQDGSLRISLPTNSDGTYRVADGGSVNQQFAQQISTLPPQLQSYIKSGPGGVAYFDAAAAPTWMQTSGLLGQVQAAGIPVSSSGNDLNGGIKAASQIYNLLEQEQGLIDANLKSGFSGAIQDTGKSILNNWTGGNLFPELQGFEEMRQAAGKIDTSTMGGNGSGFRMNNIVLDQAINNLPRAGDSLELAKNKIATLKAIMDSGMQATFKTYHGTGSLVNSGYSQPSAAQTYVQTKAGAISTNW